MLDEEERAELRALRARAFGADADIEDDPAALARWEELEGRARQGSDAHSATPARAGDIAHLRPDDPAEDREDTEDAAPAADAVGADAVGADAVGPDAVGAASTVDSALAQPVGAWRRRGVLAVVVPAIAIVFAAAYVLGRVGGTTPSGTAPTSRASVSASRVALLPLDEAGVRRMYGDMSGDVELSLVARLDRANLWWVTMDGGATTCLAADTSHGMSSSCARTSDVTDGLGVGIDVGPGEPIAYWVVPGGKPYIEVGPDILTLEAEHLGPPYPPSPSPTP